MDERTRRYVVTGAVLVGSLGLFGPLTYVILVASVTSLAALAGVSGALAGVAGSAVNVAAVLVALQTATEVAAVQLHGFDALWRGNRYQRLARHVMLSVVVLAAAGLIAGLIVDVVRFEGIAGDPTTLTLVGGLAVALLWVAVRSAQAFNEGLSGEYLGR